MNVHVIVNPHAAYGKAAKQWSDIRRHMEHRGFIVTEHFTQGMMHATSLAAACIEDGASTIVCVGGDGTFNEIVNGLMQSDIDRSHLPQLALFPVGTGSDFARTLGISRDITHAIETLEHGKPVSIDVGKVLFQDADHHWVRYFVNVFDIGLGGTVVRIANRIPKNIGGFLTFLLSSLIGLATFKRMHLAVEIDGQPIDRGTMWIVGTANGQYFGSGMYVAPMACLDDGILEVIYVKDTSIFKFILHVLVKVYDGLHLAYENVYHHRGQNIRILSESPCLIDIDGEEEKAQEVIITVVSKAIRILVPEDSNA